MAWLIGIICVVIVIIFWRIFLPLGIVVAVVIGGYLFYQENENEKRRQAEAEEAERLRIRIADAQRNATSVDREWRVYGEPDPASGVEIARTAYVKSNDGLCSLAVQKRLNGSELTGLSCPGISIPGYRSIYVKFDTQDASRKMDLKSYSDSDGVYIPSYQFEYSDNLPYEDFINGLVTAGSVAIQIPGPETFWVRFTLKGSTAAISVLGKPVPSPEN